MKKLFVLLAILIIAPPIAGALANEYGASSLIDSDVFYSSDGWMQIAIISQTVNGPKLLVKNKVGKTVCEFTLMDAGWVPRSVKILPSSPYNKYSILAVKEGRSRVLTIDKTGAVTADLYF